MLEHSPTMRVFCITLAFALVARPACAADLRLHPADVPLTGRNASQQLLLADEDNGHAIAERRTNATYASSNPKVAVVEDGRVRAVGNGDAIITAKTPDGKQATAKVHVLKADVPDPPSFRNQVIPIMTRAGCNSGACHGALAGKGGFKLSLRGYDPDADHFVLTRQALSRRVDCSQPEKSLMLLKASRKIPHGGGERLVADDSDFNLVLDWIKAGALAPKMDDLRLERIEVLPKSALLAPKSEMPVLVRAFYSDGRVEDVTRWSRFGSSDEEVAKITEEGKITVAGNGETSITVGFGTAVSTMTVTVPFPESGIRCGVCGFADDTIALMTTF